jgi:hypothetical protein
MEPKKPARKKREQEKRTTGSRSRVRIRPPPALPPTPITPPLATFMPPAKLMRLSPESSDAWCVWLWAEDDDEVGTWETRLLEARRSGLPLLEKRGEIFPAAGLQRKREPNERTNEPGFGIQIRESSEVASIREGLQMIWSAAWLQEFFSPVTEWFYFC